MNVVKSLQPELWTSFCIGTSPNRAKWFTSVENGKKFFILVMFGRHSFFEPFLYEGLVNFLYQKGFLSISKSYYKCYYCRAGDSVGRAGRNRLPCQCKKYAHSTCMFCETSLKCKCNVYYQYRLRFSLISFRMFEYVFLLMGTQSLLD